MPSSSTLWCEILPCALRCALLCFALRFAEISYIMRSGIAIAIAAKRSESIEVSCRTVLLYTCASGRGSCISRCMCCVGTHRRYMPVGVGLIMISFTVNVIAVDVIDTYCRAFGLSVLCLCSCTGRI